MWYRFTVTLFERTHASNLSEVFSSQKKISALLSCVKEVIMQLANDQKNQQLQTMVLLPTGQGTMNNIQ